MYDAGRRDLTRLLCFLKCSIATLWMVNEHEFNTIIKPLFFVSLDVIMINDSIQHIITITTVYRRVGKWSHHLKCFRRGCCQREKGKGQVSAE